MKQSGILIPEKTKLKALYSEQVPVYEDSLLALQRDIRQLLDRHGFSPTIKHRIKRFEAYYDKLHKNSGEEQPTTEYAINDFMGIRIICPFLSDITNVEQLLLAHFDVLEVERKAGQHSFREFGYDSVHLLINRASVLRDSPLPYINPVCEVQLRTILQEAWAEVEHELVYKSDIDLPNESIRRKLASLNATLNLSDLIFQEIRDFQHEVRQQGRKRRESLPRDWTKTDLPMMTDPANHMTHCTLRLGPVPKTLTSDLEKLMLLALETHSSHDFETAIGHYSKLLSMRLKRKVRALVYNHRGMAYFALGRTRPALKDFSRALTFDPLNCRGYANRGLCHRVLQQFDQALADFNRALEIDQEHDESYFGRAQCYYELGLFDQALNDCKTLLLRQPGYAPAKHLQRLIRRAML